jgi:RHS repeat-associated protein
LPREDKKKEAFGGDPLERSDYVKAAGKSIVRLMRNGASGAHTAYFTFSDHLGSPVATMNGTTGVLETERYTPFGIAMDNPNALTDQAGFTGHIKDSATGLNYMQARYYDPVMGRFLSVDPVTFVETGRPGQFNRYAYTWNDPINKTDPTGMYCVPCAVKLSEVAVATLAVASTAFVGPTVETGAIFEEELNMQKAEETSGTKSASELKGGDKFTHFVANARAAEKGPLHKIVATVASEAREVIQQATGANTPDDSATDRNANKAGSALGTELRITSSSRSETETKQVIYNKAETYVAKDNPDFIPREVE